MLRTFRPLIALLVAAVALAPLAGAQASSEGKLTLHDDPNGPAVEDIADCTFWVRGKGLPIAEGTVDVYHSQGRNGVAFVMSVEWTGEEDEDGTYSFLAGPITLGEDQYYPFNLHVEVVTKGERGEFSDPEEYTWVSGTVHCGEPYIPCIEDLAARAIEDGHIELTWTAAPNASYYHVYRQTAGDDLPNGRPNLEYLGNTTATRFVDTTSHAGVTYRYEVTASDGDLLYAESCDIVSVTAVPFFGAPLLTGLALAGALGAFVMMRRR